MTVATKPWYAYPQDSPGGGYGATEPLCPGCYPKPDTNICVPSGVPITSLLPGTVTDVSNRGYSSGGLSVTVKLDNALNSVAKYVSYNYLGNTGVSVGQKVSSGQQIAIAGSSTGICTAVALGSNPIWSGASGSQLDPRPLLKAALSGGLGDLQSLFNSSSNTTSSGTQTDCGNITDPNFITCNIDNWVTSWLSSDQAHQIMLVVFALIIMVIGIVILFTGKESTSAKAKTAS